MRNITDVARRLNVALYADGAEIDQIKKVYEQGYVKGFTTNPTLMAKAGIKAYERFAKDVSSIVKDLPISFEVFSDSLEEMEREALKIASWATNINVKIPITNTKRQSTVPLIRSLLDRGLKINVTAIFTEAQLASLEAIMEPQDDVIVSIFAGRIADSGVDPEPIMKGAVSAFGGLSGAKILWASPREVFNVYQADRCGCHIITATPDIINKLSFFEKDLNDFSLETVQMFYRDAQSAGFQID